MPNAHLSAEEAREFQTYSVGNAARVTEARPCGCQPYRDVFTYRRWKAQGFQVRRGEKAIRLPVIVHATQTDEKTGEEQTVSMRRPSFVFCRCQVDGRP